jgi:RNA polymerase sigma-70 factor, ECF subfamily
MALPHPGLHRRMEAVRPKLFRTAFAWCHNRDLAEDLAQETLAKALTKAGQLRSIDALEGWLFRIMANLWRDHVRRDRPMDPMEDVDVRNEITPEDLNSQQQTVARVRRALGQLSENYRIALTLVDIEGFSYAETAVIMEVPVGTVMSRLSRGRNQLAKLLKEPGSASRSPAGGSPRFKQVK